MTSHHFPTVSIVVGSNEYLRSRTMQRQVTQAAACIPDASQTTIDAKVANYHDVMNACTPTLLSSQCMVIIESLERAQDDVVEALMQILNEQKSDSSVIVIASHEGGVAGRSLLLKLMKAGAHKNDIPDLKSARSLENYVYELFEQSNKRIETQAARQLVSILGNDVGVLSAMCEQLCATCPDSMITVRYVNAYAGLNEQVNAFEVADLALGRKAAEAIVAYRKARINGVSSIAIIATLASKLRGIAKVAASQHGSISKKEVGMPPWLFDKSASQLRFWSSQGLATCIMELAHADEQCKSNGEDPDYVCERVIRLIATNGYG